MTKAIICNFDFFAVFVMTDTIYFGICIMTLFHE